MRIARLLLWQCLLALLLLAAVLATGRGSAAGVLGGALLVAASLLLQLWATRTAVARKAHPGLAIGLFSLKLGLVIGVAAIALSTGGIAPMSFAAGATTLVLAIVVEACYASWSSRSRRLARNP